MFHIPINEIQDTKGKRRYSNKVKNRTVLIVFNTRFLILIVEENDGTLLPPYQSHYFHGFNRFFFRDVRQARFAVQVRSIKSSIGTNSYRYNLA